MQLIFTRSSRVTGSQCTLTNVLSTPRIPSSSKDAPLRSVHQETGLTLFGRFGDFYRRFYSTISESVAPKEKKHSRGLPDEHDCKDICGSGTIVRKPSNKYEESVCSNEPLSGSVAATHNSPSRKLKSMSTNSNLHIRKEPLPNPERFNFGISSSFPSSEESVKALVQKLNDHDYLIRYLEKKIQRKINLLDKQNIKPKVRRKELEPLFQIYRQTLRRYYDPSAAREMLTMIEEEKPTHDHDPMASYIPPFPKHNPSEPPFILNHSLMKLFSAQPFPRYFLLKISYNLLISPSPPNVVTYNILLHGFTTIRQNALAHIVFQNMIDRGVTPDDYSIVGFLNLCIKSGDYDSFTQIIRIIHQGSTAGGAFSFMPKRGKAVLDVMVHGAARFGRVRRLKRYLKALRREFPESPIPGLEALTSILKFWTDSKDYVAGARVWKLIQEKNPDLRAYHQMAQLCIECEKPERLEEILKEACDRGWTSEEVLGPPPDTNLFFRRPKPVVIPNLSDISPRYARPHDGKWQRFMAAMEEVFEYKEIYNVGADLLDPQKELSDDPTGKNFEDFLKVLPEDDDDEEMVSQEERSSIWSEIVTQRTEALGSELGAGEEDIGR